jgi:hypothetical protein
VSGFRPWRSHSRRYASAAIWRPSSGWTIGPVLATLGLLRNTVSWGVVGWLNRRLLMSALFGIAGSGGRSPTE